MLCFYGHGSSELCTLSLHDALPISVALCLRDAGVSASAVDYVNAHATGTPLGDVAEGCALRNGLGVRGQNVPVSGTKGDRKSTRLNSSHVEISYAVFCLKKKKEVHT